jgi:uncharacterized protein (DUF849 family)
MTILALAPNGAYKSKDEHNNLPISDDEIIEVANSVKDLGVSMLHLHIRNESGKHSIDAKHYGTLLAKLPQNMVIQPTTEAANIFSVQEQVATVKALQPEFCSIALREITRLDDLELLHFFKWMSQNNVHPQIIIYTQNDADNYKNLMQEQKLSAKNFPVLVVVGKGENDFVNIEKIISTITNFSTSIMLCGFAELEHKIVPFALKNGYHLRIGFENNLTNKNGEIATDNTQRINEVLQSIPQLTNVEQTQKLLTPTWL